MTLTFAHGELSLSPSHYPTMPKVDPKKYTKEERKLLKQEFLSALCAMEASDTTSRLKHHECTRAGGSSVWLEETLRGTRGGSGGCAIRSILIATWYDDCLQFLSDLFTESEFVMFARRLQIAKRLLAGFSYLRIRRDLRVGLDTIQVVHEWLENKFEDYRRVIPPLFKSPQAQWERALRRAYSAHYLLLKLLLGRSAAEHGLR